MADSPKPVVFIHGLWIHPSSWDVWKDYFREHGYAPLSPAWPGVAETVNEARSHPEAVAGLGLAKIVSSYADFIKGLEAKPILIGHSFGGLITEELLGLGVAVAGVAIDPAPLKGDLPLPLSTLRVSFPVLKNPANKSKTTTLDYKQFKYAFGNALTDAESNELFERWTIPSPARPLFEAALANFTPHSPTSVKVNTPRGPLLIISGGKDHIVPNTVSKATLRQYKHSKSVNDFHEFADRGHSLTIDHGWKEVADFVLEWLNKNQL